MIKAKPHHSLWDWRRLWLFMCCLIHWLVVPAAIIDMQCLWNMVTAFIHNPERRNIPFYQAAHT